MFGIPASAETAARLKDVASIQGVESIPLIGYGLVVGLNKTGDKRQTIFSAQTLANMLERFGVAVPAGQIKIENVAAVLVTAELPAYARPGARIDVTASSVGDARSLQGNAPRDAAARRERPGMRSRRGRCRLADSAAVAAATACR